MEDPGQCLGLQLLCLRQRHLPEQHLFRRNLYAENLRDLGLYLRFRFRRLRRYVKLRDLRHRPELYRQQVRINPGLHSQRGIWLQSLQGRRFGLGGHRFQV